MKKLIEIQAVLNRIEELTLLPKYHSKFNYLNDTKMQIECFCWDQAKIYKELLDNSTRMTIYMLNNTTIEINVW